jgi:hypothetical protein
LPTTTGIDAGGVLGFRLPTGQADFVVDYKVKKNAI